MKVAKLCLIALGAVAAVFSAHGKNERAPSCKEFKRVFNEAGFRRFIVVSVPGGSKYQNLDLDGDDISEDIEGGCSPSIQQADPCTLVVRFSSGKRDTFEFEHGESFYLARFNSRVYAIVNDRPGVVGSRSVIEIGANGFKRICTSL